MPVKKETYHYLVYIQYLGFRYHGWQKQPGLKTVEFMIEKTLNFIFKGMPFKILGAGRTDAKVSANHSAFMLFSNQKLEPNELKTQLNLNLPNDIRILKIREKSPDFNVINSVREKEYLYLFAHGDKAHPFCASLVVTFPDRLDIDLMKEGARLFEGHHNFIQYCTKPSKYVNFNRDIFISEIVENKLFQADFFPEEIFVFRVRSKGFLRYQVRLMMGQLLCLGRKQISLDKIAGTLTGQERRPLRHIAPASGLVLNKIIYADDRADE